MTRQQRIATWILAVAVATMTVFTTSAWAAGPLAPTGYAPAHGMLFGAHVSPRWGLNQGDTIRKVESMIGRKFDITNRYHGFGDTFYKSEVNWAKEGRVPMVSWRATDSSTVPDPGRAAAIAAGTYDATLRAVAAQIKAVPGPVMIRFAWEPTQAPGSMQYIGTPTEYIAAWRHVVDLFRAQGVTNARWVWAPQAAAFCNGRAQSFYPGDAYVDWIAGTAVPIDSYRSLADLYSCAYPWAMQRPDPMMVWVGVHENPADASWKSTWMTQARRDLEASMPGVKALVYFNSLNGATDYWADTSGGAWTGYRAMACDPYFDPNALPTTC